MQRAEQLLGPHDAQLGRTCRRIAANGRPRTRLHVAPHRCARRRRVEPAESRPRARTELEPAKLARRTGCDACAEPGLVIDPFDAIQRTDQPAAAIPDIRARRPPYVL